MTIEKFFSYDYLVNFFEKNKTIIIISVAGVVIAVSIGVYINLSRIAREESAQLALSESLQEMKNAEQNAELWQDVDIASKTGFRQYARSSFAPYFLALQAEALAQEGQLQEALVIMDEFFKNLSSNSPFYNLYKIKQARMQLDSPDTTVNQVGLHTLQTLANDARNQQYDEALYYLGNYYQARNQQEKAQEAWKIIIERKKDNEQVNSPWSSLAEKSLLELA